MHTGVTPESRVPTLLQVVDPEISKHKLEQELDLYNERRDEYQRRGMWILEAAFPAVYAVLAASQLTPPAVVCGVTIDFSNYDFDPPSVTIVDPFTRVPYKKSELPVLLHRRRPVAVRLAGASQAGMQFQMFQAVQLMQAHKPDDIPFLCVPGVREYHAHPAHTGDHWLMHRGTGVGTLFHILNTIFTYGIQPLSGYQTKTIIDGFSQLEPPD